MEKIIFFALVIPIIGFVLYLGATAIMNGFSAKEANRSEKDEHIPNNDFSAVCKTSFVFHYKGVTTKGDLRNNEKWKETRFNNETN